MKIRSGVNRIVFLIGRFAIKIPNFTYCHLHFLGGCYGNWSERWYCRMYSAPEFKHKLEMVAPSYFCSWFGLIQVQARCEVNEGEITEEQIEHFKEVCTDIKPDNFGFYKGKLVCLDYI